MPHGFATIELQHERNILKKHPLHRPVIEQAKDFAHEAGSLSTNTRTTPRLTEILTRKSARKKLRPGRQPVEVAYIGAKASGRKAR